MSKNKWIKGFLVSGLVLASLGVVDHVGPYGVGGQVISVEAQTEDRIIRWTQSAEITTLDSAKSYDTVAYTALKQVGEGLLRVAADGSIVPAGASDYTVSEDGLTYTFTLREDAKWSNGEPVTAADYVYAWRRAVNPETGAANAFQFNILENAKEIQEGQKDLESLGVQALDDYTLEVRLAAPKANVANYLTHVNYFPQNQAFVEAAGEAYGTSSDTFLGNGPFTIEDWSATALTWTTTKNPNYYGADEIQVEQVQYDVVKDVNTAVELFEAGEVDAALVSGPILAEYQGADNLLSFPGQSHTYIEFGISSSQPLQNEDLRKAFSLVIDRDTLTQTILSGGAEKVKGLVPQNVVFNTVTQEDYVVDQDDYSTFDIALAQEHWEKAKAALGVENVELELLVTDSETAKTIGEFIQGQVENNLPGFKIALRPLPAKNRFEEMMSFDFDIAVGGWSASLGDADEYLVNFLTGAEHNHAQFFDEAFDNLVAAANAPEAVANPEERYALLRQAENYLLDRQILVPLIQNNTSYLVSDRIDQFVVVPDGSGIDFKSITFK
ncbi:TPA: peptide ABC transporter substrate-binding protein [Streptococcus suis]